MLSIIGTDLWTDRQTPSTQRNLVSSASAGRNASQEFFVVLHMAL